jgi:hypothetical protein
VVNSAPLMIHGEHISPRALTCLLANLNSFALDFVARQKVGGLHLIFFIANQLPLFPPVEYAKKCPWDKRTTLESWISQRVLKLTCMANDMKPFAQAAGFDPPVHRWDVEQRAELSAELDAAFFLLYGIARADVEYILGTFAGLRSEESSLPGYRSTTARILEAYDRLSDNG